MLSNTVLTNCTFDNNFSQGGTHGWALGSTSQLVARGIKVNNNQQTIDKMLTKEV